MTPFPVSVPDYEAAARREFSELQWAFVGSGTGDEYSMRRNRDAINNIRLFPRSMVDVSCIKTATEIFGESLSFPLMLAPTGANKLVHTEGEIAVAMAAQSTGVHMILGVMASSTIEEVAAICDKRWFQLYPQPDKRDNLGLIERAINSGYTAIVVTVDSPVQAMRDTWQKVAKPDWIRTPVNLSGTARLGAGGIYHARLSPSFTWRDLSDLISACRVPILVKGILSVADALLCEQAGAAGIIVSNHGGRGLDTVSASFEALDGIAKSVSIPVLVDGGVRRGTDILKAVALGARAVLIGRPYLYGLGLFGEQGVANVIEILRKEFEIAMALMGRTSIQDIDGSCISCQ